MTTISERIEDLVQRHYEQFYSVPNTLRMCAFLYEGLKQEAKARMDMVNPKPERALPTKLRPILKYQSYLGLLNIVVVERPPSEYMEVSREWSSETYEKEREKREEEQRKQKLLRDYIQNAESFGIKMKEARIEGDTIHATVEVPVTPEMLKMYEDGIRMKE